MANQRGRPRHPDILTPAEWSVFHALRHGLADGAIARARRSSRDGVKYHVDNIKRKLGVSRRADLRQVTARPGVTAPAARTKEDVMASEVKLGSIGQIALTVSRLPEAEAFYRDTLGLPHMYTFGNLAFFDCGGTRLFITASDDAAHSGHHSVVYFRVDDIDAAHRELVARSVTFEGAPHMIHRHEDGTEEWMAFFRDPDGNILAIMSQERPASG